MSSSNDIDMSTEEIETLLEYHSKILARWAGDRTTTKEYLTFHARRILQLIDMLYLKRESR